MRKELALAIALAWVSTLAFARDTTLPGADKAVPGAEKASPNAIGHSSTQYQSLDADGDGYLSQSEARANSAINFSELDADKDGKLSMQELADAQRKGDASGPAGRPGDDKPSASGPAKARGNAGEAGVSGSAGGGVSTDRQK